MLGESGSGKSTFIKNLLKKFQRFMLNSLPSSSLTGDKGDLRESIKHYIFTEFDKPLNEEQIQVGKPTTKYEKYKIKCPNVKKYQNFQFNIIDSPGYGSVLNNEIWINDVVQYIQKSVSFCYII